MKPWNLLFWINFLFSRCQAYPLRCLHIYYTGFKNHCYSRRIAAYVSLYFTKIILIQHLPECKGYEKSFWSHGPHTWADFKSQSALGKREKPEGVGAMKTTLDLQSCVGNQREEHYSSKEIHPHHNSAIITESIHRENHTIKLKDLPHLSPETDACQAYQVCRVGQACSGRNHPR